MCAGNSSIPQPAFLPGCTTFDTSSNGGCMSKIQILRRVSFHKQSGLCYYCQQPMWAANPKTFSQQHMLTINRAKWLRVTAEHLDASADGGKISPDNIVAACLFCNVHRHKHRPHAAPAPDAYLRRVRNRVASGKWHGINIAA